MHILLIFAKPPVLGKVKTRLAASLGQQRAVEIYEELLQYAEWTAQNANVDKRWIFYSEKNNVSDFFSNQMYEQKIQKQSPNLGVRMKAAFEEAFAAGATRVTIIGSDCPELHGKHIDQMAAYSAAHICLAKTLDGGYAALSMPKMIQDIFDNIDWSTDRVYDQTMAHCKQLFGENLVAVTIENDGNSEKNGIETPQPFRDLDTREDFLYHQGNGYFA